MKLWLVRHAQPVVATGVCYGALDLPADVEATRLAALALARELPHGAALTSSPLQRCEQLAQCLRGLRPDLSYGVDARLAEMNFGTWEGQRWDAIARAELDGWTAEFANWRCGGAESVQQFMGRVAAAWDSTRAQARDGAATPVWITHAGVIRAAQLITAGQRQIARADQWPPVAPGFGRWWVL